MPCTSRLVAFVGGSITLLPLLGLCVFYAGCEKNVRLNETAERASATPTSVTLTAGKSLIFAPANGFEGIQEAVSATMSRTADGLKIHALNKDPYIFLPRLEGVTPGNKVTVHVQLVSPGRTIFQIFYSTNNDVVVEFTEPDFKGRIRLDPGMLPGDYILKLVEVRSSAAP